MQQASVTGAPGSLGLIEAADRLDQYTAIDTKTLHSIALFSPAVTPVEPEINRQVEDACVLGSTELEDSQATVPADTLQLDLHNLSLPSTDSLTNTDFPQTFRQTFPFPDTMVDATAPANVATVILDGRQEDPKRRRAAHMEDEVMSEESEEAEPTTPKTAKRDMQRLREARSLARMAGKAGRELAVATLEPRLLAEETSCEAIETGMKSVISRVEVLEQRPAISHGSSSGGSSDTVAPFSPSFVLVQFKLYNCQAVAPSDTDAKTSTKAALAWVMKGRLSTRSLSNGCCYEIAAAAIQPDFTLGLVNRPLSTYVQSCRHICRPNTRKSGWKCRATRTKPRSSTDFMRRQRPLPLQLLDQARTSG